MSRVREDLRGWGQVALEPGETAAVPMRLRLAGHRYWHTDVGEFFLEPIAYELRASPHSGNPQQRAVLSLE